MAERGTVAREGRPTLESVAAHAAVSRQTVSNVLNAPHLVAPQTLDRVKDSISELRYRPHRAARQLRTRRSQVIGLRLEPVRDGINGAVLDRFLHALTERAQVGGYRIELFTADDDTGEITQYEDMLESTEVDAFVLTSTHAGDPRTRWLADRGVPFVTFGRPWGSPTSVPDHPWVDVDGAAGTRAATTHLVEHGHRRIAYLGWPPGSGVGDDRRSGWRNTLVAEGLDGPDTDVIDVAVVDSVAEGVRATRKLLGLDRPPTAVVCASDSLALGALTATAARHTAIAIIGFDDTPVAAAVGLSSVAQPLDEVARHAFALLQLRLEPPSADNGHATSTPPELHRLLEPRLVVRSLGSVPAR